MKKILALTSIRSDYDLMSGLYHMLHADPELDLRLLVSGAHLSERFGHTVDLIRQDGLPVLLEINSLVDADTKAARLKTASKLLQGAIDAVEEWQPDLILIAGDREDVLIGAMLGAFLSIPTIHFFGGDHEKDGHLDTVIRHASSKLATFHVVAIEQHKQRLIKMGEPPERILVAGSIALDKFVQHKVGATIAPDSVFPADKKLSGYAMVIYHPIEENGHIENTGAVFESILLTLKKLGIPAIVSYPNSDPGHRLILEKINHYKNDPQLWFYPNLERNTFLSLFKQAQFLIGNSSSGILEAASIPLGAINVGTRQQGRLCGDNVVFCGITGEEIEISIKQVTSKQFQDSLANISNPYGDGQSCAKIAAFIKATDFKLMQKKIDDPLEMN